MYKNIFRPTTLDEFVGNKDIVEQLKVFIYSAKKRQKTLDHIILYGPPGVGKTSLATVIANEIGSNILTISGKNIEKVSDLITVLSSINKNDVLFIDEIHCLDKEIEEVLYSVMEDFKISINYKTSESTRIIEVEVEPFTLIGATTKIGNILTPLFDRFGIKYKLEEYSLHELKEIIDINSRKISLEISSEASEEIAKRSKKTPRIAINYLKRINDYAIFTNKNYIDKSFVISIFNKLKVDELGLNFDDYKIIKIMYENYLNKPVSLKSISIFMNESIVNLENIYEPYLVYLGIIERTKQGRRLTEYGKQLYLSKFSDK